MDYRWCHGPKCHKSHTQDRIRGVKGSKVLRTRNKIPQNRSMFGNGGGNIWDYFCNHRLFNDFAFAHWEAMLNIEPRLEALETPIEVTTETREDWSGNDYKTKVIKEVDNRSRII